MVCDKFGFLKRVDYFGVQQAFRVNSNFKYRSRFGGLTFVLYLMFAIGYFFYSFKSYVNKEIKNVVMSENLRVPAPGMNMKDLNFVVAFGITFDNDDSFALDFLYQYLEFSFNYVTIARGEKSKTVVPVRNCTHADFPFSEEELIISKEITKYLCLNNTNYTLEGIYSDPVFSYLEYTISLKQVHLDNAELKSLFMDNPLKLNIFFTDIALDMNNLTNTKNFYLNSVTNYIIFDHYQKHNLDFILLNFTDDGSIVMEQPVVTSFVKFFYENRYYFPITNRKNSTNLGNSDKLYRIYLRTNQQTKNIKREFQKLPAFIANVSGISSNVLLIMFLVINFINEFKLKESLINRIFNFKDHIVHRDKIMSTMEKIVVESYKGQEMENEAEIKSERKESVENLKSEETERVINPSLNDKSFVKSNLDTKSDMNKSNLKPDSSPAHRQAIFFNKFRKVNPVFQSSKNLTNKFSYKHAFNQRDASSNKSQLRRVKTGKPLQFTFLELIYSFFCCSPDHLKVRKEIYQKGRNKLHYYLDVLTLIKKFQEFDIIKSLIFSKEHLAILNFLSKPIVSINQLKSEDTQETEDFSNSVLKDQQINQEEIEKLYESYMLIKKKQNKNKKDEELIARLEKKLRMIVEEE